MSQIPLFEVADSPMKKFQEGVVQCESDGRGPEDWVDIDIDVPFNSTYCKNSHLRKQNLRNIKVNQKQVCNHQVQRVERAPSILAYTRDDM